MSISEDSPETKHSMDGAMAPKRPFRLLVKRLAYLFLIMYFVILAFWVTGNLRSYLDSTQSLLLGTLAWDSVLLTFFALVGIGSIVVLPLEGERRQRIGQAVWGIGGYILLLAIGIFGAFFGDAILTLAAGLR
ncbi:MAG TPA: hypothetical protein VMV44_00335 [Rectinemataceae bacterium]|nr:hypothetical protein [Rectinemataceae bacterium]